jgi:aspergillopepsin I
MPSLVSALSALAVVSFALATPIWRTNQTFTIHEEVRKPFVPGPVHLLKRYRKYGIIPPSEALAAAVASSSVTATPYQYDWFYLCPVTIGGQTLNLDLDTGSADL